MWASFLSRNCSWFASIFDMHQQPFRSMSFQILTQDSSQITLYTLYRMIINLMIIFFSKRPGEMGRRLVYAINSFQKNFNSLEFIKKRTVFLVGLLVSIPLLTISSTALTSKIHNLWATGHLPIAYTYLVFTLCSVRPRQDILLECDSLYA